MPRNKFQSILKYIRFDDKNFRTIRQRTDKFDANRELWKSVIDNCQKSYFPHADVTINELLFSCRSSLVCIYNKQFTLHYRLERYYSDFLRKQLEISKVNLDTNDCFFMKIMYCVLLAFPYIGTEEDRTSTGMVNL